MNETILFPDVAATVVAHLRTELPAVYVGHTPPRTSETGTYVVVYRTGGVNRDHVVDLAQITVDTYAQTNATAHDTAQLVRAHINALTGTVSGSTTVYRVNEFSGPAYLPDPTTQVRRYRQTFQIGVRGAAV